MITAPPETQQYVEAFELLKVGSAGIGGVRKAAIERFAELGFPTIDDEEWRFTSTAPIARIAFETAPDDAPSARAKALARTCLGAARAVLVFVNGRLSPELSGTTLRENGLVVASFAERAALVGQALAGAPLAELAAWRDRAFTALNTAFLEDGAFVKIAKGAAIEEPIYILYLSDPGAAPTVSHPRTLVVAEEGAEASIVEIYAGPEDAVYFTNAVTEIALADSAKLDHVKLQREGRQAFHVATMQARCGRASVLHSYNFALGGALARNDVNAVFDGEGCDYILDGLYIAGGKQHVDNHTLVDHVKPHCAGREVYRGILDGAARAVFNGKIIVRPDAQKTDAKQTNKNLLLSEEAEVNTKPQLEIFANDVKCTHGATVGRLDEEALFYLRARGIPEKKARSVLTHAFASEITAHVKVEAVRAQVDGLVRALLHGEPGP